MSTLILTVPSESTDPNQPTAYPDAIIDAGSLFLFDFLNPACNPLPPGALGAGAVFNNLVPGKPSGSLAANGSGSTCANLGTTGALAGLSIAGASGAMFVDLGTSYDLHAANAGAAPAFVVAAWGKPVSITANSGLVSLGSGVSAYQYTIEGSSGGANIAGAVDSGTAGSVAAANNAAAQFAVSYDPVSGLKSLWKNGSLVAQAAAVPTLADYSAFKTRIGADPGLVGWRGTLYRAGLWNLTVSGRTAAAVIADDYAANVGRFT